MNKVVKVALDCSDVDDMKVVREVTVWHGPDPDHNGRSILRLIAEGVAVNAAALLTARRYLRGLFQWASDDIAEFEAVPASSVTASRLSALLADNRREVLDSVQRAITVVDRMIVEAS